MQNLVETYRNYALAVGRKTAERLFIRWGAEPHRWPDEDDVTGISEETLCKIVFEERIDLKRGDPAIRGFIATNVYWAVFDRCRDHCQQPYMLSTLPPVGEGDEERDIFDRMEDEATSTDTYQIPSRRAGARRHPEQIEGIENELTVKGLLARLPEREKSFLAAWAEAGTEEAAAERLNVGRKAFKAELTRTIWKLQDLAASGDPEKLPFYGTMKASTDSLEQALLLQAIIGVQTNYIGTAQKRVGIAALLPEVAEKARAEGKNVKHDSTNIACGCRHLVEVLHETGGRVYDAVACYLYGPGWRETGDPDRANKVIGRWKELCELYGATVSEELHTVAARV